mgnify:FL=1
MKRGFILIGVLGLFLLLIACAPQTPKVMEEPAVGQPEKVSETLPPEPAPVEKTVEDETAMPPDNTIKITSSGFEPKTLTVKAGTTVTFVNEDSNQHWPASAVHPTHAAYPESGGCIGSKFDACKVLAQGESFSFTFNEKGSWNYHDHLRPSNTGKIVVE